MKTGKSGEICYDYLVVAPGLVFDLSLIEELEDTVKRSVECSNYLDPEYTLKCLQKFKGSNAALPNRQHLTCAVGLHKKLFTWPQIISGSKV